MKSPTERFSGLAREYAKYRPRYPGELISWLSRTIFTPGSTVADIGSGTGIFCGQIQPFVRHLYAVEPNRPMREYSIGYLAPYPNITVVDGTAESTTLHDHSIDIITAAQSFHWFDRERARAEFSRILRAAGNIVLVWYERINTGDRFREGYERLLHTYSDEYAVVDHRNVTPDVIREFFRPGVVESAEFPASERMDFEAVRGRFLSASYIPPPGDPRFGPLMDEFRRLFDDTNDAGLVEMRYRFRVYAGKIVPPGEVRGGNR